ncbi:hypothetical protein BKA65DRAFT_11495 [Rhexocercosporidium sp. MPI-PUGE-AT-0058]|nr:hypothetical protein BKA65DRAFT_11495 [Rhexocercosporidium sp. MPI-PUGE-AT-0058]
MTQPFCPFISNSSYSNKTQRNRTLFFPTLTISSRIHFSPSPECLIWNTSFLCSSLVYGYLDPLLSFAWIMAPVEFAMPDTTHQGPVSIESGEQIAAFSMLDKRNSGPMELETGLERHWPRKEDTLQPSLMDFEYELGFAFRGDFEYTPISRPAKDTSCEKLPLMSIARPFDNTLSQFEFSGGFVRSGASPINHHQKYKLNDWRPSTPVPNSYTSFEVPATVSSSANINFIFESAPLPRSTNKPGKTKACRKLGHFGVQRSKRPRWSLLEM